MFWITKDPSSGSLIQCLAENYKKDSIMSVYMDKVGVMVAYSDPLCMCVVHCIWVPSYTVNYTQAQQVRICCHNTDLVHVNGHDRTIFVILTKHCTRLPDDGSFVIQNMLEHF